MKKTTKKKRPGSVATDAEFRRAFKAVLRRESRSLQALADHDAGKRTPLDVEAWKDEGQWAARVRGLRGVYGVGRTRRAAKADLRAAVRELLKHDARTPCLPPLLEKAIARAFIKAAPKSGRVPAQKPYRRCRDEKFIRNWCVSTKTSIPRPCFAEDIRRGVAISESVIEAIFVGLRAGYSEADIAAYIKRNYAVGATRKGRR